MDAQPRIPRAEAAKRKRARARAVRSAATLDKRRRLQGQETAVNVSCALPTAPAGIVPIWAHLNVHPSHSPVLIGGLVICCRCGAQASGRRALRHASEECRGVAPGSTRRLVQVILQGRRPPAIRC